MFKNIDLPCVNTFYNNENTFISVFVTYVFLCKVK